MVGLDIRLSKKGPISLKYETDVCLSGFELCYGPDYKGSDNETNIHDKLPYKTGRRQEWTVMKGCEHTV